MLICVQKYKKINFPLAEKFFGFAEKLEKFFKKFFRTKIAKKKRKKIKKKKKEKKNPSNFSGSLLKKFSAKQNFSGKSGGYF